MEYEKLARWFSDTPMGIYTSSLERRFFEQAVPNVAGKTVQFGMEEWLRPSKTCICIGRDVLMHRTGWAFAPASVSLLLMPHTLDTRFQTADILREAFRALSPEGKAVITGFNPHSLWRLRQWLNGRHLPAARHCHALPDLKKQLSAAGFQIERGQFMVYLPPVQTLNAMRLFRFMEPAGNRWWPHAAAVYGLVVRKRVAGLRPLEEHSEAAAEHVEIVWGTAKESLLR